MRRIKKILIANRGEIACRVMRTAQSLGIETVAVYSDADANALHVKMADEAVHIGPSTAAESYLNIDKIIAACKVTGADAVHPGYGFLSENPAFVRALMKHDIIFIGPSAESMEAMGLKDAAKTLMEKSGVPVTPGYQGKNQDCKHLKSEADKIGYPVLIKAIAGGGGKGMRKVEKPSEFQEALKACQREAKSSFGDDRVLIEKYISSPRHIEVQVFGDVHGKVIHMFERDCSVQRRHQKVIEEAPAPGMTESVRSAMTKAAIAAAKAVNYVGAGTVEFIVDGSKALCEDGFWFMEMNTRLQVEHPVTEMITGLDLVELQIRVAEGRKLPAQKSITMSGHAMEARLYAEDPAQDFMPSVGKLDVLALPGTGRVDTGVEQGGSVSIYYDPMIAKLISYAPSRGGAIEQLTDMCRMTQVYPIKTNASFLMDCLETKDFQNGNISTHFIAAHSKELNKAINIDTVLPWISLCLTPEADGTMFGQSDGFRLNLPPRTEYYRTYNGQPIALPLEPRPPSGNHFVARAKRPEGDVVFIDGQAFLIGWPRGSAADMGGGDNLTAPMPGKIIAVNVKSGDKVTRGGTVIVMEAMKMEMSLSAPSDGVASAINVKAGDMVADGDILLELKKQ